MLSRTSDYAGIGSLPGDRIFFVQLADAPRLAMDVLQWSRHHRLFPLQGGFDLAGFTARGATPPATPGPVAGGVQRRVPAGRPAPDRGRRDAVADRAARMRFGGSRASPVRWPRPRTCGGIAFAELDRGR